MGVKKLPKVKELQTEYAKLLEEKKKTTASGKLVKRVRRTRSHRMKFCRNSRAAMTNRWG